MLRDAHAYFQKIAPVLYFILSKEDKIVEANQYAKDLTGRRPIGEKIQDLIVDFTGQVDLPALIKDTSKEHLLNIETASGLPQSFYFRIATELPFFFQKSQGSRPGIRPTGCG